MARLNKEEYEILKTYISEEKYIAKDRDGSIRLLADYLERDMKREGWSDGWGKSTLKNSANNFQFIQWEDEEPYEIAELIREYKIKELRIAPSGTVIVDSFNESEEKEVKKNKEWLRNEIKNLQVYTNNPTFGRFDQIRLWDVEKLIDQMDEPEVLSKEWIDNNSINASHDGVTDEYVHVDDLKNLLVPKQELSVIPKFVADWWERDGYSVTMYGELRIEKKHKLDLITKFYEKGLDGYLSKVEDWIHKNHSSFLDLVNEKPYEIEKEKLYYIKFSENQYAQKFDETKFDSMLINEESLAGKFTKEEIEKINPNLMTLAVEVKPPSDRLVGLRENKVGLTKLEVITYLNDILPPDIQMNASMHYLATDVHEFEIKLDGVMKK